MLFQLVNVVTFLTCVYVKISDIYINSLFIGGGGGGAWWVFDSEKGTKLSLNLNPKVKRLKSQVSLYHNYAWMVLISTFLWLFSFPKSV